MKKKEKIFKKLIAWISLGILASFISHIIIELLHSNYDFVDMIKQNLMIRPMIFLYGSIILFLFYILFSSLTGSSVIGSILLVLFSWIVGISTNLKTQHRAEPLYPNEISWIKELPFLLEIVGPLYLILILGVILGSFIILYRLYKYKIKPKKDPEIRKIIGIFRIFGILITLSIFYYISLFNYPNNKVKKIYSEYASWITWSQPSNYKENGFIAGFLSNLNAPPMDLPSNYSKEAIEKISQKYKAESIEINKDKSNIKSDTNVIYIMNESFSDPFNLEGITSNKDPLPNFREIVKQTQSGTLLVPGFGGGTATNEFQVLTGVSLEPLSSYISSPFIQMTQVTKNLPSIVNRMNEIGYRTTAIHSSKPENYRRNDVYVNLGFNDFIHQNTMKHTDTLNDLHPYISDESTYQEMFDVLEGTNELNFLHVVTMQNHSGYRDQYENNDFNVSGSGDYGSAVGYFQDLENSDQALFDLIEKLENYSEPVLLLFWGDHLPGFYKEEVTNKNSSVTLRETPFFIYSNKKQLQGDSGMVSLIYLNNYILKLLNLKISPFEALMFNLEENLPVVDNLMFYDNNKLEVVNSRSELSEQSLEVLDDYTLLLYDITTGKQFSRDMGFFDVPVE